MFDTWVFNGERFLAVPTGEALHVVDRSGRNYGTWYTVAAFREAQRKGSAIAQPLMVPVSKFGVFF